MVAVGLISDLRLEKYANHFEHIFQATSSFLTPSSENTFTEKTLLSRKLQYYIYQKIKILSNSSLVAKPSLREVHVVSATMKASASICCPV